MEQSPTNLLFRLATATVGIAATGAIALGYAVPGIASDAVKTEKGDKVIIHMIKHGEGKAIDKDKTIVAITSGCETETKAIDTETSTTDESGKIKKTRIVICKRGAKDGDMVAMLEKSRASIAEDTDLSEEARKKAVAALDAEIARLKNNSSYSRQ